MHKRIIRRKPKIRRVITVAEQREWVEMLAETPEEQIEIIKDLLAHGHEDGMLGVDRVICRSQLARLQREIQRAS